MAAKTGILTLIIAVLTMIGEMPVRADNPTPGTAFASKRVANPSEPDAIPLYAGKAPGSEAARQNEVWSEVNGELWARNVTRPTLTPYLPEPGSATGTAVLVVPGGGFKFVSLSNEGWPVAEWLAERGVAAFVLKYRVEETPKSEAEFGKQMMSMFRSPPRKEGPSPATSKVINLARADAQAALRMIRANAEKWRIDPGRVGMLGFSAGAMTTLATTLADAPDARPDFIAPIYGFMTPVTPPPNPQPMFVALASDDMLFNKQGFGLVESWAAAGGSTELHWYQGGGHGFGSHKRGTTSDRWFDQFMAWMAAMELLEPAQE